MPSVDATKPGMRVIVDTGKHPLPPEFVNRTLEVVKVDGDGDKALVFLAGSKGLVSVAGITERFLADELLPANAQPGPRPRVAEVDPPMEQSIMPDALYDFAAINARLDREARRIAKERNMDLAQATKLAGEELVADVEKYHLSARDHAVTPEPVSLNTTGMPKGTALLGEDARQRAAARGISFDDAIQQSLIEKYGRPEATSAFSLRGTESFDDACIRVAREAGISLRDAVHRMSLEHPELAEAR